MITAERAKELLDGAVPGPWRVGSEGSEGSYVMPDCEDKRERSRYITLVGGRVQPLDGKNARLIAAAPDLAETVIAQAAMLARVAELANRWERGALRWADPLPVPPQVALLREALGVPA